MNDLRFIRRKEVEAVTGLSRSSIYAMMKDGSFPKQVKLGTRSVAWCLPEIQEWANSRVAASRIGGAPC